MNLPEEVLSDALEISKGMSEFDRKMTPKWNQNEKQSIKDRSLGTVGEFALRWVFGMPQPEKPFNYKRIFDDRHNADVGENVEVRSTDWKSGRLLVRPGHDDIKPKLERDYCLVVVDPLDWSFRIPGWLPMRETLQVCHIFRSAGRPDAKAVHQRQLKPIKDLVILDNGNKYKFISRTSDRIQEPQVSIEPEQASLF